MKKLIAFLLAALFVLALAACGDNPPTPTGNNPTQPPTQSVPTGDTPAHSGIYFAPGGVRLELGADPVPALEALGDPLNTFESQSCALKAKDINYRYPGFVLTVTYPEQGDDYITQINLTNDDHKTPGGITIGSAFEEVVAVYGTDYREDNGHFYYTENLNTLHLAVTNGAVSQITYEYKFT